MSRKVRRASISFYKTCDVHGSLGHRWILIFMLTRLASLRSLLDQRCRIYLESCQCTLRYLEWYSCYKCDHSWAPIGNLASYWCLLLIHALVAPHHWKAWSSPYFLPVLSESWQLISHVWLWCSIMGSYSLCEVSTQSNQQYSAGSWPCGRNGLDSWEDVHASTISHPKWRGYFGTRSRPSSLNLDTRERGSGSL